jgi:dihydrofolate synthase/folylpolyglutamate synthase
VWLDAYRSLQGVIERFSLTFFEATTLIAFEIFKREKVSWAVFETGLGGRLDATNVVVPAVAVISRIAIDHREYLGESLGSILREKLGIIKKGIPLVMADPEDDAMRRMALTRCGESGAQCRFVAFADAAECVTGAECSSFCFEGERHRIALQGRFQVSNALLALSALKAAGLTPGHTAAIGRGMAGARLPGRFQTVMVGKRPAVFDVGHNPDAAGAFCRSFRERFNGRSLCLVLGIMKDKDIAGMAAHYASVSRRIICTAPATERAASPESIKKSFPDDFPGEISVAPTVARAVEEAFASSEEVVCITGSFLR